jgi:hypothetical protein
MFSRLTQLYCRRASPWNPTALESYRTHWSTASRQDQEVYSPEPPPRARYNGSTARDTVATMSVGANNNDNDRHNTRRRALMYYRGEHLRVYTTIHNKFIGYS